MSFKIAMLRAFESKPLLRYIKKMDDGIFIVRSERSYREWLEGRGVRNWIGWPSNNIFEYDKEVFKKLERLYGDGAKSDLEKEWSHCKPLS